MWFAHLLDERLVCRCSSISMCLSMICPYMCGLLGRGKMHSLVANDIIVPTLSFAILPTSPLEPDAATVLCVLSVGLLEYLLLATESCTNHVTCYSVHKFSGTGSGLFHKQWEWECDMDVSLSHNVFSFFFTFRCHIWQHFYCNRTS
jgi:hypothetical protein